MSSRFTRRRFLVTAGAAASTVIGSSLINVPTVWAAPYTRRNLGGMSASDPVLVSYRKAIHAMKALPSSNPLSWDYQAAIHGTTLSGSYASWNTCQHGSPFFWSWHRMYLYWFERIIRKMSGDSSFALPFWDYTSPSQRTLPAPFQDPSSELYVSDRGTGWNTGAASFPGSHVDPSGGNSHTDFSDAQSGIESNPHVNVHADINGLMGHVATAAEDPVFYVHHCNIDRLWNLWLALGGGRYDPMWDGSWTSQSYSFFDENGKAVTMSTCDILRAAEQLNYVYEGEPAQVKAYCLRPITVLVYYLIQQVLIPWPGPPVELTESEVAVQINVKELRQRLGVLAESKTDILLLELENVEAEREPGVVWEVYLGLPPNAAPNAESPFFVGTVALFGGGVRSNSHGQFKPAHFRFRVNRAIAAALRSNQDQLAVLFVPSGPLVNGKPSRPKVMSPVRIGAVNLSVGREQPREGKIQVTPERPRIEVQPKPK